MSQVRGHEYVAHEGLRLDFPHRCARVLFGDPRCCRVIWRQDVGGALLGWLLEGVVCQLRRDLVLATRCFIICTIVNLINRVFIVLQPISFILFRILFALSQLLFILACAHSLAPYLMQFFCSFRPTYCILLLGATCLLNYSLRHQNLTFCRWDDFGMIDCCSGSVLG